jgi:hypothetical protein
MLISFFIFYAAGVKPRVSTSSVGKSAGGRTKTFKSINCRVLLEKNVQKYGSCNKILTENGQEKVHKVKLEQKRAGKFTGHLKYCSCSLQKILLVFVSGEIQDKRFLYY